MSQIYDALRKAESERAQSFTTRLWRMVPRLMAARTAPPPGRLAPPPPAPIAPAPLPAPAPPPRLAPGAVERDLAAIRGAMDRLDARLSHELAEREKKLLEELRRGMLGLETELSERFAASVLENRRLWKGAVVGLGLGLAVLAGVVIALLALG